MLQGIVFIYGLGESRGIAEGWRELQGQGLLCFEFRV